MNQNLPKLILVGVGIVAVIVAIMLALKPATTATSATPVAEPSQQQLSIALEQADLTSFKEQVEPPKISEKDEELDSQQEAHLNWLRELEWLENTGRLNTAQLMPYANYNLEVLKQLAQQCDLKALYTMSLKPESALNFKSVYYVSAVCGSTRTLNILVPHVHIAEGQTSDVRARERKKLLVLLAMYEVAAMRGNKSYISYGIQDLAKYKIILTEAEKQTISNHAKKTYGILEAQRAAWGFPPFNNYIPDDVNKWRVAQLYKLDNPSGWGLQYYEYAYDGSPPW